MEDLKEVVSIEEFKKLDIRVGTVIFAEKVTKSNKLLRLKVDFGSLGTRQILSGMQQWYSPEDFIGKQLLFVINLSPREMMGFESHGMILALGLSDDNKPVFIVPQDIVENGEVVR